MKKFMFLLKLHALAVMEWAHAHLFAFMARQGMVLGANTLTDLIPTLYESLDVVSREMIGFIPAVSRNSNAERAALNEDITIPVVGAITAGNVTPGLYAPDDGDATVGNTTMTISKSRYAPVRINGEETVGLNNAGTGASIMQQRFAQAFRTLTNEMEADLAALYIHASRAYGAAATVPFGTAGDLTDLSYTRKILEDNGAPTGDLQLVLGSGAIANLRGKQNMLLKVNEAGNSDLLRYGVFNLPLEGMAIRNSAQIKNIGTAGTNNGSAATDATGYAVGSTTITLGSAGTGTIIAGDIITFAGDTNKYVVKTGDTDVSNGGSIVLQEPGLRVAIPASATVITTIAAAPRNMAFSQSAIQLATRAPALPDGGDSADDRMMIVDPVSGIQFEICVYRQYRQVRYEVAAAWGVKVVAPRHVAVLIG